jgi:DNA-binding SARP family transcriptional activator
MSGLELRFLGVPEVWKGGRLLKFPTRKSLALLIYLAVAGSWHSREKLVTLLWPESPTQQGQASLRNALIRLRRTLAEAETQLLIEGDLLSFDLSVIVLPPPSKGGLRGVGVAANIKLDLLVMATAAESSDLASLQEAVAQYRGDFLEGFTLPDAPAFEEWAGLQREYWHRQLSEILARLSQLQAEQGQVPQGLNTARRWTAHDPLNEAAHRRLMELYLIAGDKAAALQAYESCRTLLASELAAEPSPETKTLAERIRNSGTSKSDFGTDKINLKSKIQNPKSKIQNYRSCPWSDAPLSICNWSPLFMQPGRDSPRLW